MWKLRAMPSITKTPWSAYDVFVPENLTDQLKITRMERLVSSPYQCYIPNMDLLCLRAYKYPSLRLLLPFLIPTTTLLSPKSNCSLRYVSLAPSVLLKNTIDSNHKNALISIFYLLKPTKRFAMSPFSAGLELISKSQTHSQCVDWVRCSKQKHTPTCSLPVDTEILAGYANLIEI